MRKACTECRHNRKEDFKGVCLKCLNDGGKEFEQKQQPRLIDANEFSRRIERYGMKRSSGLFAGNILVQDVLDFIAGAPTVEVEPVIHAHWVTERIGPSVYFHCSKCGATFCGCSKYCGECGARMNEAV